MRAILKCNACKKTTCYDSGQIKNIGTFWELKFLVYCEFCGEAIYSGTSNKLKMPKLKDMEIKKHAEGYSFGGKKKFNPKTHVGGEERTKSGDIREYWIQHYFAENYEKYGFKNVKGPSDVGPDFQGIINNRKVDIEIERDWECYIQHGHPKDSRFNNVKYLIVLNPKNPPKDKQKDLPKIIYIDIPHFLPWWRNKCADYKAIKDREAASVRLNAVIHLIVGHFQNLYMNFYCDRTNSDMAICPHCESCAYAPEINLYDWAWEFLVKYDHQINEDFSLSEIKQEELQSFFTEKYFGT